ncbi:MAG: 2-isopropylmalate synthase, partial [Thiotrichales bacterium]
SIVLGKHSGRNAFRARLAELNISLKTEEELNAAFSRFKDLADRKHDIYDEDLQMLVLQTRQSSEVAKYQLIASHVCSETGETPTAAVTLKADGKEVKAEASGSGPVDAVFSAIKKATGEEPSLQLYSVNAITSGTDAQGEVTVRLEQGGRLVHGHGAHTDIVIASAKSYIDALNKLESNQRRAHPQHDGV